MSAQGIKTCCVTGHRDIPAEQVEEVKRALWREIEKAIADGFTRFLSGFAQGQTNTLPKSWRRSGKVTKPSGWRRLYRTANAVSHC